jgi:hypothetical protein
MYDRHIKKSIVLGYITCISRLYGFHKYVENDLMRQKNFKTY